MASSEATASDLYLDYVARPYEPLAPWQGKLRSEALYDASAEERAGLLELKASLQKRLGRDRTVFGVKEKDGRRYWELYVYNYERKGELSAAAIGKALEDAGWTLSCGLPKGSDEIMVSFELGDAELRSRDIDALHLYTISEGAGPVTSRSYLWKDGKLIAENVYLPMPLDTGAKRLAFETLVSRLMVDAEKLLPPALTKDCRATCWAFKPATAGGKIPLLPNSLYLSTLRVDALELFLKLFGYGVLAAFVAANRSRLDHLLYDVGYDFASGPAGVRFTKSGFYGTF